MFDLSMCGLLYQLVFSIALIIFFLSAFACMLQTGDVTFFFLLLFTLLIRKKWELHSLSLNGFTNINYQSSVFHYQKSTSFPFLFPPPNRGAKETVLKGVVIMR